MHTLRIPDVMDIEGHVPDKHVTTATVVRHKGSGAKGKKREIVLVCIHTYTHTHTHRTFGSQELSGQDLACILYETYPDAISRTHPLCHSGQCLRISRRCFRFVYYVSIQAHTVFTMYLYKHIPCLLCIYTSTYRTHGSTLTTD
jgi:hypothetical protein